MFNLDQIFTVDLNNQDTLFKIKFKIQFQNSIQDCDIVESNSSWGLQSNTLKSLIYGKCRSKLLPVLIFEQNNFHGKPLK